MRILTWLMAEFCGVQIITYCILSAGNPPEDQELHRRVGLLYGKKRTLFQVIDQDLAQRGSISPELRGPLLQRMGDVSMYLKELKQRFTRWFNRTHNRYGTLWAERFKSMLVEDQPLLPERGVGAFGQEKPEH